MSSSNYVSVIKLYGKPILPPVIFDEDRPLLRKYREEAIKVEARIAERKARMLEEQRKRDLEKESDNLDQSTTSNIDTKQVMNFIRQALKDSSHLEEVQNLQLAIFEELQKYKEECPSLRKGDSMDTLHNIEDFSTGVGSSREVSPLKSFPSENFPSPPKSADALSRRSYAEIQDVSPHLDVPRCTNSLDNLVGPQVSLNYRTSPLAEAETQSPENGFSGPEHGVSGPEPTIHTATNTSTQEPDTPPSIIRRNSYTLESPSPSVLMYLKSLNLNDDTGTSAMPEKTIKRNLNQIWSEVLSTNSSHDLNSITPTNQSAGSWKSDSTSSYTFDNISLPQITASDVNLNCIESAPPIPNKVNSRLKMDITSNGGSRRSYCDSDNAPISIEVAATRIQAGVRGYLTRRLMKTGRVIELKNAIRDSLITALQMHSEPTVSKAELELHGRLALQIESLCDEWHQIFFEYTPQERMRIIAVDRHKAKNPRPKKRQSSRPKSK